MKIHLDISKDSYEEIKKMFESKGFEISSDGEYVIRENRVDGSHIYVRKENGDREVIPIEKILYIESFRHQLVITTEEGVYTSTEPLYQMEQVLQPALFIRISKSVIVAKRQIKKIKPGLSMKFILIMKDGKYHEVTRSYYSQFKQAFKI